jgi:hypothetical protein
MLAKQALYQLLLQSIFALFILRWESLELYAWAAFEL